MLSLDLLIWTGVAGMGAVGVGALMFAAAGCGAWVGGWPAARFGRRACENCACCGYSLHGLEEDRCPECGRMFADSARVGLARLRVRAAVVGVMLLCAAGVATRVPRAVRDGWVSVVPTVVLAKALPWMPGVPVDVYSELDRRVVMGGASEWEKAAIAEACADVLTARRNDGSRRRAARLMAWSIGESVWAAEVAAACVDDPDAVVRLGAVNAIGRARMDHARALRILARAAVMDKSEIVRRAAVNSAARIGCDHADVVESLTGALHDPSAGVRERALYALAGETARSPRAWRAMASSLLDASEDVREAAVWAVGHTAERGGEWEGESWVMWLATALGDTSPSVRASAAFGLRDMGRSAAPALARLSTMMVQEDDAAVRYAAQAAVEAIVGEG